MYAQKLKPKDAADLISIPDSNFDECLERRKTSKRCLTLGSCVNDKTHHRVRACKHCNSDRSHQGKGFGGLLKAAEMKSNGFTEGATNAVLNVLCEGGIPPAR